MDACHHVAALRAEGPRMAGAAGRAGLDARVPTCPEWLVRDLVRHTGGVHRWATAIVTGPRTEPWNVDLEDVVGTWPSDDDLLGWFLDGHAALVAALDGAEPTLQCWTFLRAPTPLAMWARRQTHETTIHRVDAESADGATPTPVDPPLAADGIDELLTCFITRRGGRLRADPPVTLRVRTLDTGDDWQVRIGPDRVETARGGPDGGDDCQVRGPASDLYLGLWNRRGVDDLRVDGDAGVLDLFLDRVHVRWS